MGGFLFLMLRDGEEEVDEEEVDKVWMGGRNMADW